MSAGRMGGAAAFQHQRDDAGHTHHHRSLSHRHDTHGAVPAVRPGRGSGVQDHIPQHGHVRRHNASHHLASSVIQVGRPASFEPHPVNRTMK